MQQNNCCKYWMLTCYGSWSLCDLDKNGEYKPVGRRGWQACYCSWSHMDNNYIFPGQKINADIVI